MKQTQTRHALLATVLAAFACVLLAATPARAQLHEQTFVLQPGWNSIYLEVEPDERAIESIFSSGACSLDPVPLASIWTYDPRFGRVGTPVDPAEGLLNATGWFGWFPASRPESSFNTLFALRAGRPYLIKLFGNQPVSCTLGGTPRLMRQRWTPDSFNLAGFPVDPDDPPTFDTWFAPSQAHDGQPVFRLDAAGRWQSVQPTFEVINPGEAYWIFTNGASDYQGPLEIDVEGADSLEFDAALGQRTMELRNNLDVAVGIEIESLSAPNPVALRRQQIDEETTQISWPVLPQPFARAVGAEAADLLTLAPDRSAFTDRAEQVLTVKNGLGSRLLIAVGADAMPPADRTGLWIGSAVVDRVGPARCETETQSRCVGVAAPAPLEVQGLTVFKDPAGQAVVSWTAQDPGVVYDIVGGLRSQLLTDADVSSASCVVGDLVSSMWLDQRAAPPVGDGYYYLTRSRNPEVNGTYGGTSGGAGRVPGAGDCPGAASGQCEIEEVLVGQCSGGAADGAICDADLGSQDCPGGTCLYCETVDATPTPVGQPFDLPLLVHVDDQGQARLLKEVIQMLDPPCTAPAGVDPSLDEVVGDALYVLLTDDDLIPSFEGVSLRGGRPVGARISTAAYDFDATSGGDWDEGARAMRLSPAGSFGTSGVPLTVDIVLPVDFATHPLRHRFHPDHDEAPEVVRRIELTFDDDFQNADSSGGQITQPPQWGSEEIGGFYRETITGLHRQPLVVEGRFLLQRAATIPVLNPSPQTCS